MSHKEVVEENKVEWGIAGTIQVSIKHVTEVLLRALKLRWS